MRKLKARVHCGTEPHIGARVNPRGTVTAANAMVTAKAVGDHGCSPRKTEKAQPTRHPLYPKRPDCITLVSTLKAPAEMVDERVPMVARIPSHRSP